MIGALGRLICAALILSACGDGVIRRVDAPPPLPVAPRGQGFVEITCAPANADLYVDGRYHGRLDGYPRGVLRLPVGAHRLTLSAKGYSSMHFDLEIGAEPARVETHLVPEVTDLP